MSLNGFNRRTLGALAVIVTVGAGTAAQDISVTIAPDLVTRAGIETAPARRAQTAGRLRIPATIQANAYRQIAVLATAGGRVASVPVELGQRVNKGDPLMQVYSPEVAEAERAYVGKQADLTYLRQQIARLERLVTIGAASQQELDAARAQQTILSSDVEGARARLLLLGRTAAEVAGLRGAETMNATITYVAPIAGTVTARAANPGQTIDTSALLLTIVDLSTVWIVGDVYERDVTQVRVGSPVTITSAARPGEPLSGRIAYIDPQVATGTRTARVRAEIANPGGRLLLGMIMEMQIDAVSADAVLVPRTAVQTIGDVPVVYVADPGRPGTFTERSVLLGAASGSDVAVLAGIAPGDAVVTVGSFFVRAERSRSRPGAARPVPAAPRRSAADQAAPAPLTIDIRITEQGFTPPEINVPANTRIRLRFTRQVEKTCATEVVFPALKLEKALPVGTPVIVDLPPQPAGRLAFACGMDMYRGQLIVK